VGAAHITEKGGSCRSGNLNISIEFFHQGYAKRVRVATVQRGNSMLALE